MKGLAEWVNIIEEGIGERMCRGFKRNKSMSGELKEERADMRVKVRTKGEWDEKMGRKR